MKRPIKHKQRRSIYIEDKLWDFISDYSEKNDRSINWVISNILNDWYKIEDDKRP